MDRRRWIWSGAAVWCVMLGWGIREIYGYSTTEGAYGVAPARWPDESSLVHATTTPTVIMFIHPECPCTRASLQELAKIVGSGNGSLVEIVSAARMDARAVEHVPGAVRVLDPEGREAARFGAATSGHVVVYDAAGTLRFTGGITGSRGHAGDNVGRRMVEQILDGKPIRDTTHAVFGCVLP